jgi:hypothetical protein
LYFWQSGFEGTSPHVDHLAPWPEFWDPYIKCICELFLHLAEFQIWLDSCGNLLVRSSWPPSEGLANTILLLSFARLIWLKEEVENFYVMRKNTLILSLCSSSQCGFEASLGRWEVDRNHGVVLCAGALSDINAVGGILR